MSDTAKKLADEAKAAEADAKKHLDDLKPNSPWSATHTAGDKAQKTKKAEEALKKAAEKREEAAKEYANDGDDLDAALEYDKAADNWAKSAELQKEQGNAKAREAALQKQIDDLQRSAGAYDKADKPELAKAKREKAKQIKDDYEKENKDSKLQLEAPPALKSRR